MQIPQNWTFKSDHIADHFDQHVREQLPWYDLATFATAQMARHYVPQGGNGKNMWRMGHTCRRHPVAGMARAPHILTMRALAFLLLITAATLATAAEATVMAPPETGKANILRQVGAIPMTWRIRWESGAAPGHKSCFIISRGGDVTVRLFKQGQTTTPIWSVRVGFDNQPGSLRYLRINKRYFQTDQQSFRGAEAGEIVALLKTPGVFAFEWAQRSDHAKRPGLFGTGDFASKAAACERWLNSELDVKDKVKQIAAKEN
jgi:hypothetical protein